MPRKKNPTPEELRVATKARELADAREKASRCGEPTYFFSAGDNVHYGAWPYATILNVLDNGRVYHVYVKGTKPNGDVQEGDTYQPWIALRPLTAGKSRFSSNDDIRLNYSNRSMESLIFNAIAFGIDFEPEYQRGYIWKDSDREALFDSIFMGADIGRFVLRKLSEAEWRESGNSYEIVDGKQRLLTLLDYYQNRFAYRGVFYNDLSPKDRRKLMDLNVSVAEVSNLSRADTLRLFIMLNRGGRPVSNEVIRHAQALLYGLKKENHENE